jgi:outer membrane biosynthesis protein TonB
LKKPAGSVRFRFYKKKTEKTELNRNRKKLEKNQAKTEPNRVKTEPNRNNRATPKKTEPKPEKTEPKPEKTKPKPRKPSQTEKPEPNRFDPVSVRFRFFFFKFGLVTFFDKNRTEPKMITPSFRCCVLKKS